MRNLKKVLVLVLALAMMLSLMVMGASAVAFTDQSKIDSKHQEAVDMCVSLNIINGMTDGSFDPQGNVTREQMAKMICVLDNGGKEPQLSAGTTFSDVAADRWSNKYIESCAARGVVAGVGDGKFNPSGNVTATQAAKMLLVELGYDQDLAKYTGASWATNVNIDATKKGYYEDLEDIDVSAPLSREHAAQMIWNALQANEVEYKDVLTTDPATGALTAKVTVDDKTTAGGAKITLLRDKYNGDSEEGILVGFTYDSKNAKWTYYVEDIGGAFAQVAKSTKDFTDLLGMNVKLAWDRSGTAAVKDAYGIFASDSKVLFSGKIADLPTIKDTDTSVKFDGTSYKAKAIAAGGYGANTISAVPVELFEYGADVTNASVFVGADLNAPAINAGAGPLYVGDIAGQGGVGVDVTAYDAYEFLAIDNDDDDKIDVIMVQPYEVAKVSYCVGKDIKLTDTHGAGLQQALIADGAIAAGTTGKLTVGDDVTAYDGIAKNDIVKYIPDAYTKDNTGVVTKAELVSGRVTMNDAPDVTINGTKYTVDDSYGGAPATGSTLTDAAVVNGFIFDIDSTARKEVKDFAVVIATDAGGVNGNQAKLLFSDNTKKVVTTDKDYTPATGAAATALADGSLVTFRVNSDNEYKLTRAPANWTDAGYDLFGSNALGTAVVSKISNSSDKVGYVNGEDADSTIGAANVYNANVVSSTVAFINYEGTEYKAITGDALKKINAGDFAPGVTANFPGAYALGTKQGKNANSYDLDLVYLSTGAGALEDADTFFGYVCSAVLVENSDGDTVTQFKLATKDGEQTFMATDDFSSGTVPGNPVAGMRDVIEYKTNSSGEINDIVTVYSTVDTQVRTWYNPGPPAADGFATVGITKWSSTVEFQALAGGTKNTDGVNVVNDNYAAIGGAGAQDHYFETDSDTEYIYIENDDHKAADKTSIEVADDSDVANLTPNAFVIWDKDGDLVLVVYDVDNDITH